MPSRCLSRYVVAILIGWIDKPLDGPVFVNVPVVLVFVLLFLGRELSFAAISDEVVVFAASFFDLDSVEEKGQRDGDYHKHKNNDAHYQALVRYK